MTSGGTGSGGGGTGSGGGGTGGSGGASGGSGGASGGSGGGSAMPTAVADIMGLNGKTVTGTATFTQGATMTTLVLNLSACPAGVHASHLHEMPDCGNEGNAAGGHWMPNGVDLGDYTCADNKVTYTTMKPVAMWTVGDGSATDITKHAFMVHEMGDAGGNPGGRIGCGVPMKK
jgi:Cu/Zn superoxide dismutase